MSFPDDVRNKVLFKCKRYCCLCGQYAGIYMELHHIKQKADGGYDTEENCIPLCFKCHADVRSYNPHHPKGLKYGEKELKLRRDEVYEAVKNNAISDYLEEDILKAKGLLAEYYQVLENIIYIDPCGQPVDILLIDSTEDLLRGLKSYRYIFINEELDRERCCLIESIMQWRNILCNIYYFHFMDEEYLCFNSDTVNEYCEVMKKIRTNIAISYMKFRTAATRRIA